MNDVLTWILDFMQGIDPTWRTLVAGIGMLLETSILVGLVVPGDTIVIIASTGVETGLQWLALILAIIGGSVAGESIGFALGRFFGPKIRTSRLGVRVGYENWMRAENYLDRRGGIAVFLSRFLPVFHSIIPLTVGMSTMRFRKFLAWTLPACTIWATTYASVGWAAAGTYRELSRTLHNAGYVFAGIIVAFLLVVFIVRVLLTRHQRRHMEIPGDGDANTREDLP